MSGSRRGRRCSTGREKRPGVQTPSEPTSTKPGAPSPRQCGCTLSPRQDPPYTQGHALEVLGTRVGSLPQVPSTFLVTQSRGRAGTSLTLMLQSRRLSPGPVETCGYRARCHHPLLPAPKALRYISGAPRLAFGVFSSLLVGLGELCFIGAVHIAPRPHRSQVQHGRPHEAPQHHPQPPVWGCEEAWKGHPGAHQMGVRRYPDPNLFECCLKMQLSESPEKARSGQQVYSRGDRPGGRRGASDR